MFAVLLCCNPTQRSSTINNNNVTNIYILHSKRFIKEEKKVDDLNSLNWRESDYDGRKLKIE